ncbi:MAG: hypothetical protein Q4B94_04570 [Pseudomonadota bacterium]|nr:hypothetical protein [Pseudomonadota bacterium]
MKTIEITAEEARAISGKAATGLSEARKMAVSAIRLHASMKKDDVVFAFARNRLTEDEADSLCEELRAEGFECSWDNYLPGYYQFNISWA